MTVNNWLADDTRMNSFINKQFEGLGIARTHFCDAFGGKFIGEAIQTIFNFISYLMVIFPLAGTLAKTLS